MIAVVAIAMTMIMLVAFSLIIVQNNQNVPARISGQTTLAGFILLDQHKDTWMPCILPCGPPAGPWPPHVPNDVKGPDLGYGTVDDCPHCSAFCAPGSIAMIATFRGVALPFNQQDDIYDAGKKSGGEIQGNGAIETHGQGMFDGMFGTPWEVQDAFNWSIGAHTQHNQSDATALTAAQLKSYIVLGHPVLWLDHGGHPANMSDNAYSSSYRNEQGHAKVITGYGDNDTADLVDDICLIHDPWPEYNDMMILPKNATKGPGGTWDPYWLPLNDVNLSDIFDKYLVDKYPDIPEYGTLIVPIIGTIGVIIAISAFRRKENKN